MSIQTINPNTNTSEAPGALADWKEIYPEHFVVEGKLLTNQTGINIYRFHQIEIITYFRLNENCKPEENAVVYLIETVDGSKGILIYRFDVFTDCKVYSFLKEYVDYKKRLHNDNPEIRE